MTCHVGNAPEEAKKRRLTEAGGLIGLIWPETHMREHLSVGDGGGGMWQIAREGRELEQERTHNSHFLF